MKLFNYILIIFGVLLAFTTTAHASEILFYDTFTDSNFTQLDAHTPDTGTGWTQIINNGVNINSILNTARVPANILDAGSLYAADTTYNTADYNVSAIVTYSPGGDTYPRILAGRIQDVNNMYALRYTSRVMQIYKRTSGTWSQLTSQATIINGNLGADPSHGETVTLRIDGNTISGLVDGVVITSTTDSDHTLAGKAGMGLGRVMVATDDAGTGIRMDNFTVQTIDHSPTISTLSPADNATGVAVDANLVITFSEAVDAETGNITIYKSSDDSEVEVIDVTSGQVTGSGTGTITINPSVTLDEKTQYYVQIDATAFDDADGNSFAGVADSTTWNFTTLDATNPVILSTSPVDNATGVAVDANLTITFDEAVDVESGNITINKVSDLSVVATIDVTSGQVTGSGTDTITINPTDPLESDTEYYIFIAASAFDDTAGNSFAGIVSDTSRWTFTTVDTTDPFVSTFSPADNATDIAIDANLIISFSEPVDVESGNIVIKKASDDTTVATIDVTSGQVTGSGSSTITINPIADLAYETEYYVQIDATAFDDVEGNSYAGIADETTWSFTTASAPVTPSTGNISGSVGSAQDAAYMREFFRRNRAGEDVSGFTVEVWKQESSITATYSAPSTTAFSSMKLLRRGDRGVEVQLAQMFLNKIHEMQGGVLIDGIFGGETDSFVRKFQTEKGLLVDGIVGPETMRAMLQHVM